MNTERQNQCLLSGLGLDMPLEDRLIDREAFAELAVSNRRLLRFDESDRDLMGLVDAQLGIRFLTPRIPVTSRDL